MLLVTLLFAYGQIRVSYRDFNSKFGVCVCVCVFIELVFGFLVSFQFFPVVLRRNSKFNVIQFHILSTSNCSNVHIDVLFSSLVFVVCVCKNDSSRIQEWVLFGYGFWFCKMIDEDLLQFITMSYAMACRERTINANQFHYRLDCSVFSQAPANMSDANMLHSREQALALIRQTCNKEAKNYYQHMHINFYELLSLSALVLPKQLALWTCTRLHALNLRFEYNLHKNVPSSNAHSLGFSLGRCVCVCVGGNPTTGYIFIA